jgi:uncharacterized protein YbjT (DUF2867 family)
MTRPSEPILVFGATGKQGGATAHALLEKGWRVRALVRDPSSKSARALAASGVELVHGDQRDRASIETAVQGTYGVFSVQPSSGQPGSGVTDDDEQSFGIGIADAAKAAGVKHLVYASVSGAAPGIGIGHFESKANIERHIRSLGISATILRPAPFMEIVLEPIVGLAQGSLTFFSPPDLPVQFIAVRDVGEIATLVFSDPYRFRGETIELAGDILSGNELAAKIGQTLGRAVTYRRFPPSLLSQSDLLRRIVELIDQGTIVGRADIDALRRIYPGLLTFDAWLVRTGADRITKQMNAR